LRFLLTDGAILPVNRRQRVYPNGTLVIEHAQRPADAGTYTCQAQNRQKHTARRDVEVQVLGKEIYATCWSQARGKLPTFYSAGDLQLALAYSFENEPAHIKNFKR